MDVNISVIVLMLVSCMFGIIALMAVYRLPPPKGQTRLRLPNWIYEQLLIGNKPIKTESDRNFISYNIFPSDEEAMFVTREELPSKFIFMAQNERWSCYKKVFSINNSIYVTKYKIRYLGRSRPEKTKITIEL